MITHMITHMISLRIMGSITTTTVVGAGCSQSSLGTAMITQTQSTTR